MRLSKLTMICVLLLKQNRATCKISSTSRRCDTIRSMINKYGERNGGELHHDNCFYVQNATPRMDTDYNGNPKEVLDDVHIQFKAEKTF